MKLSNKAEPIASSSSSPSGPSAYRPSLPHARNELAIRQSALQPQDQVHSTRLRIDSHLLAQHAFQACRRRFPALGIELSHPLDMARECPSVMKARRWLASAGCPRKGLG